MIASDVLVEIHSAPGTRLGDLAEVPFRPPFFFGSILRLAALLIGLTRLVFVHDYLADDAIADAAELAGEDVAVSLG